MGNKETEEIDVRKEVEILVKKAAEASDSSDAMRFSQAACNAANAAECLRRFDK